MARCLIHLQAGWFIAFIGQAVATAQRMRHMQVTNMVFESLFSIKWRRRRRLVCHLARLRLAVLCLFQLTTSSAVYNSRLS